jgi:SPP1 gp7 family putative phage head morphogenesis protein
MFKYAEQYIEALIKGIFEGKITEEDLPESLYHAIADHLKKGVYKGFGATIASAPKADKALLNDLRENIYMFSAAKTFRQVREMTDALTNDEGTFVPFNEFKKEANQIFDTYNKDYLKTEYDTAIGQSQMASKWQSIQAEKDVLPFLEYSTIGDACMICEPLNGYTAKVDDPIWDTIMPMNHFNCRCLVEQLPEEDAVLTEDQSGPETALGNMNDAFKMNPGKDGYVFSPDHPYFTVQKEYKELAEKNFNLKIPEHD